MARPPRWSQAVRFVPPAAPDVPPLTFPNGAGGFSSEGREYIVVTTGEDPTPLPWSNILANPGFGTLVTAAGSAHTWAGNSRENRLDAVCERRGERPDVGSDLHLRRADGPHLVSHARSVAARVERPADRDAARIWRDAVHAHG